MLPVLVSSSLSRRLVCTLLYFIRPDVHRSSTNLMERSRAQNTVLTAGNYLIRGENGPDVQRSSTNVMERSRAQSMVLTAGNYLIIRACHFLLVQIKRRVQLMQHLRISAAGRPEQVPRLAQGTVGYAPSFHRFDV
jgi:hypothetical protein